MVSKTKKTICTLVIATCPVFAYKDPILGVFLLPELLFCIFLFDYLLNNKLRVSFEGLKTTYLFLVYALVTTLLNMLMNKYPPIIYDTVFYYGRFFFYIIMCTTICRKYFDYDLAARCICFISALNSVLIVGQHLYYNATGIETFLQIPFLEPESEFTASPYFYRPGGIFSEPSHFANYVIVAFMILLFYKNDTNEVFSTKLRTFYIILCTIGTIFSTSGAGVYMMILVYMMYIPTWLRRNKTKNGVLKKIVVILLVICIIPLILSNSMFNTAIDRGSLTNESGSTYDRVFKGYEIFESLPFIHKFIGVGYSGDANYAVRAGLELNGEYVTTFSSGFSIQLNGTGLIGIIIYIISFIEIGRYSKSKFGKLLVFMFFLSGFFSSFTKSYYLLIIYAFAYFNEETIIETKVS